MNLRATSDPAAGFTHQTPTRGTFFGQPSTHPCPPRVRTQTVREETAVLAQTILHIILVSTLAPEAPFANSLDRWAAFAKPISIEPANPLPVTSTVLGLITTAGRNCTG